MNKLLLFISAVVGVVLGVIGTRFLFVGSALSLIPWGIIGLVIGWLSKDKKQALITGGVYGFFLAFTFMVSGYSGKAPIVTRIPPFAALGLVGMICGLMLGVVGIVGRKQFDKYRLV